MKNQSEITVSLRKYKKKLYPTDVNKEKSQS